MQRCVVTGIGILLATAVAAADDWPQFRGPHRDNISRETGLLRAWPAEGPKLLWSVEVCQGYSAAAIHGGRVYFNDYSPEAKEWYVRCLKLADGRELWRYTDAKKIRPNHGITRTAPAVDGKYVFALDPKCVFHCLDAKTGKELWRKSFVKDYKARIPPWYNGQNPLIESDRVIIAIGGEALMVALRKETGEEVWRTPNPESWPLAHASVMPAELDGVKQYLWCTLFGPIGVSAEDGSLLWFHPRKFNVAVAPSPLPIGDDRVFMTAGYDAGSIMLRVRNEAGKFTTEPVFDWADDEWSSDVHTPILYKDHLFAVSRKKRGLFTCLDLDGNEIWTSRGHATFELGSYLLADGMFFVLEGKTGKLRLLEASTNEYHQLASTQVLHGHDVWGPMALSNGKLVLRDMTKMVCIEVGKPSAETVRRNTPPGQTRSAIMVLASLGSDMKYRRVRTISGKGSAPDQFSDALRGLAFDSANQLHAVGDSALKVFSPEGKLLRSWPTEQPVYSVTVAADGSVFVGQAGQIQVFDRTGKPSDTWRDIERLGLVSAIAVSDDEVLIADSKDRCIRRYDRAGKFLNNIGKDNRMKGFVLPNGHLDFAVDEAGIIHAANPGKHRVERYTRDDKLLGRIGRFGGPDPTAGFNGCCNPTNVALTPNGRYALTVKADPHVKLYDRDGKLLELFGRDDFDANCKNMDVAVDSSGRIYVVDTVRLHICVFAPIAATKQPAESSAEEAKQP